MVSNNAAEFSSGFGLRVISVLGSDECAPRIARSTSSGARSLRTVVLLSLPFESWSVLLSYLPPMCRWRRVQTASIRCVTLAELQDIPDCSPLTSIRCVTLARKCRHGHHFTTSICEGRVDVPASL